MARCLAIKAGRSLRPQPAPTSISNTLPLNIFKKSTNYQIFSDGSSRFGQREPPLTDQIVNILGRYPDGGQILKVICKCNPQSAQRRVAS